ncbi:amino acid adenylation domain-containing protein [Rhodococcus sp. NPDC055112]
MSIAPHEVVACVADVLGVPVAALDPDEDLTLRGLDSISAMKLAGQWRRTGSVVRFVDLLERPTLSEWVTLVSGVGHDGPELGVDDTPVVPSPGQPFDLATMQHAYWAGRQDTRHLGGVAAHFYNEFDGRDLEPARLEAAVRALLRRHDMLRAAFDIDGRQRILTESPWRGLHVRDFRHDPDGLERVRAELSHRQLDVARGEVFDIQLSLTPDGTRVHVNLDMLAADAQSLRVLFADLAALYRDPQALLPELGYSYARYLAEHARRASGSAEYEAARAYWRDRLPRLPAAPELPKSGATVDSRVIRRHSWLAPEARRELERQARRRGLTPAIAVAAAFAEVIAAWSSEQKFLLNLPLFDREPVHPDVAGLVGDFTSSVLVAVDATVPGTFAERAGAVQSQFRADAAHAAYPGVEVLRDLGRHHGETMLAPVVYTSALGLGELFDPLVRDCFGDPVWIVSQGPQVLLDAQVTEFDDGLLVNWDARRDALAPGVLEAMFGAYTGLLNRLCTTESAWDEPVPDLRPDEQLAVRAAVNATTAPQSGASLHERVFALADATPDAPAVLWGTASEGTEGSLSYGELARQARELAATLPAGHIIPVHLPKGPEQIVRVLGILAAGSAYLPVGIDQPPHRRDRILANAGPHSDADGSDLAYVLFTSGSTGEPKGVQIPHSAAANTIDDLTARFEMSASDRTLAVSALDFDLSVFDMFAPLTVGGAVVVVREHERRDPAVWADLIATHRVTVLNCVPAVLDMLVTSRGAELRSTPGLEGDAALPLRCVLVGGDWVGPDLPGRLHELAPDCVFAALGGTTETAIHSTIQIVDSIAPQWRSVPYGVPLRNVRCRVVDALGRDRPDWVPGELHIGGAGVARGYLADPDLTRAKFGSGWYRTGDLARYWPDGTLEFLGRTDHQVKIRGHRVDLGEIEAALTAHPAVSRAVAVAIGNRATAAVTPVPGADVDPAEVVEFVTDRLPEAMLPDRVRVLEQLPLSPNGKIDRAALRELMDENTSGSESVPLTPPDTTAERQVAAVWSQILGIVEMGREHDFFVLGGDSMLATRMIGRFPGVKLADLYENRTLADFASALSASSLALSLSDETRELRDIGIVADPDSWLEPFPISDVQRAYWIGRDMRMTLGGVDAHFYTEFDGVDVDVIRLEDAWSRLITRHPMLRAVIDAAGQQRVLAEVPWFRIPVVDAQAEYEGALADLRAQMSHQVRDPQHWPLCDLRAVRYRLDGRARTRIGVSMNNLVLDGLSIMIVLSELDRLYREPELELPPVTLNFRDYVHQVVPQPAAVDQARSYWRDRLAQLPPAPALPLAVDPAMLHAPRFERRVRRIDTEQWRAIGASARAHGVTTATTLLTCYAEVLGVWSGQRDLTVNLTVFDRSDVHPDINRVVGDFTSLLLVACRRSAGEPFATGVRRVQEQLGRDLSHREVSAVWVLRELARRSGTNEVAMPVVFTSVLGLPEGAELVESTAFGERVWGVMQTPQTWLDCKVYESDGGLVVEWDAVAELFPPGVLDAMFEAYLFLVGRLADGDWSATVPDLLPVAQRAIRQQVNDTGRPAAATTLHDGFFATARRDPDRTALLWDGGQCSYAVLADGALRVAAALVRAGVRPGDLVVVSMPRGPEQIAAVLGVLAAGAAYVPIDVDQPAVRRDRILSAVNPRVVLGPAEMAEAAQVDPLDVPVEVDADGLGYVIFTSGSTGEPKGVSMTHAAAMNTIGDINSRFQVTGRDRVLAVSALDFDLSVYDIFGLLSVGGALVLVTDEARRDAQEWIRLAERCGATVWNTVPTLLEMLLVAAEHDGFPDSLRVALVSGDWVGVDLPARVVRHSGGVCRLVSLGGATEAAIWSNAFPTDVATEDLAGWTSIPYGFPLRGQHFRVVDPLGADCPDWVAGELWIGGAGVARGYHADIDATERAFPVVDGQRWYRTGDVGRYRPGGVLEFLGRRDSRVKVRGHRIELGEIETALHAHPDVDRAVVVAPGQRTSRRLVGFIVADAAELDSEAVKEYLSARLPGYAVPASIAVVDTLPLTANGKVDRRALEALAASADVGTGIEPPHGPIETAVAELWSDLLGVTAVGRHDNFFTLGGDSLLATRLIPRLRAAGLAGVELANLFAASDLAAFAAGLSIGQAVVSRPIIPAPTDRHEPFPLTDVQEAYRIGRTDELVLGGVGSHYYVEYDDPDVDLARLELAWNRLIARHEMLRAVIDADGTQRILPEVPPFSIRVVEAHGDPEPALSAMRADLSHQVLDPTRWPVLDVRAVRYDSRTGPRARVGVSLDNLVLDGISMMIVLTELDRIYREPDAELPPVELSFRDYLLQRAPEPEALVAAEDYWRARVRELPPSPQLPLATEPMAVSVPRFVRRHTVIATDVWAGIRQAARAAGVTPSALLLAAYAEVLGRWSGRRDLSVTVTLFDRQEVHVGEPDRSGRVEDDTPSATSPGAAGRVVGDFTSVLMVGYDPVAGEPLLDSVRRLQAQLGRDLDHAQVSGIWAARELARQTGVSGSASPVVFTSMVGVADEVSEALRWPHWGISQTPQVWLDNQVVECSDGLHVAWDAVADLFEPTVLDDMFAAYSELLNGLTALGAVVQRPGLPARQRAVRDAANATADVPTGDVALHTPFFAFAATDPDRTALCWSDDSRMSYGELAEGALRVAAWLRGAGVVPGDLVAVTLPRGIEQVIAVLGVLSIGAVYVPLGVDQPASRRQTIHDAAGIRHVIEDLAAAEHNAPLSEPIALPGDAPAYVIFTSGTTGVPKGVEITHRAATNTVSDVSARIGLGGDDRILAVSALDFDLSVYDLFGPLSVGGAVVLLDDSARRDPTQWLNLIRRHGVSVWNSVPMLLEMLLVASGPDQLPDRLRVALVSGDRVDIDLPARLTQGSCGRCRLVALGGATEAAIWSTALEPTRLDTRWTTIPYGPPLRGQYFRVVDGWEEDCPDWVAGELWIGGAGLATGYRADPERTAERFVQRAGTRWYRTGDGARYLPDGNIELLGRLDDQVKVRGHRVELGEVEAALRSHPAVDSAVVVVVDGHDLHAWVIGSGNLFEELDVQEHVAGLLPGYAVPTRITVVDAFPLTANGKLDRNALRGSTPTRPAGAHEPPVGEVEITLARLWAEQLPTAEVGRHDNFFTFGGNSLLATRLAQRVQQTFGVELSLREFFTTPTVAALGRAVERHQGNSLTQILEEGVV